MHTIVKTIVCIFFICFDAGMTLRDGDREYYYSKLDKLFPGLSNKYIKTYENSYNINGIGLVCLGALVGGLTGAFLSKKINVKYLKLVFGLIILYVGVKTFL